jgi:hypothetical protein
LKGDIDAISCLEFPSQSAPGNERLSGVQIDVNRGRLDTAMTFAALGCKME